MDMLLIFLWLLVNTFQVTSGAEQETLCTRNACFTVHMARVSFEVARHSCEHSGGYLMTVRDREEEDVLRCLLSKIQRGNREQKFWIGLKLHKGDCVLAYQTLRGFKWISGEEDSSYSNWEREPVDTCTGERCVRVLHTLSGEDQLKWKDGSCKSPSFYVCKFYFKGMCNSLKLMGPGQISYTAPFSDKPQRYQMQLLPFGTYADVSCDDQRSHLSVCKETEDGYRWSDRGPFCRAEEQSCIIHNGGCQHLCQQEAGGVRCFCKEGYSLEEDGFSCRTADPCRDDAEESGYFCKCPDAFKLEGNRLNCTRTEEQGSAACGQRLCGDGSKMVDGRCSRVDECEQLRCEHGCSNSSGSSSCFCQPGFSLSQDGRSCVDINEAAPPAGPAEAGTLESFTGPLTGSTVQPQHQSPPFSVPVNVSESQQQVNASLSASSAEVVNSRVLICVLGSLIPLLILVAVTLAIAIFRCNQTKKEAKKNATTDGYCWVSPGLDPRLEKLYESILTDDL